MAGLGPRVGSAHVEVNLDWDGDVGKIGRQIHRQLQRMSQRNGKIYRRMGQEAVTAWRAALGTILASAPHMGSAISAVAASATMLAGALHETAVASGGLIGVAGSLGLAMMTLSFGFNHVVEAINEIDPNRLKLQLAAMTPPAREFTLAMRDLVATLRSEIQPRIFAGLLGEMQLLRKDFIPVVTNGFLGMADALNGLIKETVRYVTSAEGLKTVNTALQGSVTIFDHLAKGAVPFLDGFLKLHNALIPASTRLADRIANVGKRFQEWASAPDFAERIDNRMRKAEKTAGLLWSTLKNLWGGIRNVFAAANPATNSFFEMLDRVATRFREWSASAEGKNSIAEWASAAVTVMGQLGKTIAAVFAVTSELADPRAIITFLTTVQNAFQYLAQLPLDKAVDAFVRLAAALEPISGPLLAIISASAAVNIIFGNLIGQTVGLLSAFFMFKRLMSIQKILTSVGAAASGAGEAAAVAGTKVGIFSRIFSALNTLLGKVVNFGIKVVGFFTGANQAAAQAASGASRMTSSFQGVLSVLGRFAKIAGVAGIVVWVGTIIAKSDELKAKLGDVFKSMGGVFVAVKDALSEIGAALAPVASGAQKAGNAMSPLFNALDKIMAFVVGGVMDMLIYGFESVANVIRGAGSIIAGFINVLTGIFTLDFGKMWDGIKQIASGLGPLLSGLFGIFVSFFAPARFLKLASGALKALGSAIGKGISSAVSLVGKYVGKLGGAFKKLLSPLAPIGAAFKAVFDKIVAAAKWLWDVLFGHSIFPDIQAAFALFVTAVTTIINGWVNAFQFVVGVFQTIGTALLAVFTTMWTGITTIFTALWTTTTTIWNAIWTTITTVADLIWTTITTVFNAIWNTITTVMNAVWDIISSVWNSISSTVSSVVNAIWGVITSVFNSILGTITSVWNNVKSVVSSAITAVKSTVTSGLDNVWQSIKGLPGKVLGLAGDFLSAGKTIGSKVVDGMAQGLKNIVNGIGDFGRLVKNKVNSALGLPKTIRGPGPIPDFTIPGFARGVRNFEGGLAMVGERGPELVNLPPGSDVFSNRQSRRMIRDSVAPAGQVTNQFNITLSLEDLSQLHDLEAFLDMMDRARVSSRRTLRSGTVSA